MTLVSECNIRLKHELKNGRYDWFRPIYETNLQDSMVKANKELQIVIDSSSFQRGSNTTKYKKEGKIFTFQANEPISIWITPKEKFLESIDHKGDSFVEYFYGENVCLEGDKIWVKNNPTKFRLKNIILINLFIIY